MRALVTGASSGIGRDMARYLNSLGYDLIITARCEEKLQELKNELNTKNDNVIDIIVADLSKEEECKRLYRQVKEKYERIDLLVNNAGFGLFGEFENTDLTKELAMIDTNIKAVHILTKLFLKDMIQNDSGRILNVASIAGFMPGPLMATYYSTKAYVVRLTQSIRQELFMKHSKVKISALCPGPVNTNFNKVADVKFNLAEANSKQVAKYAVRKMFANKILIFPSLTMWLGRLLFKITPDQLSAFFCYFAQKRKIS